MSHSRKATEITVMFDWGTGPFWVTTEDDPLPDEYSTDEINDLVLVSEDLVRSFAEWNNRMQRTFDADDPASSGFADPEKKQRWIEDGRELTRRLKSEVPGVHVKYRPPGKPTETFD
ncbi:hypothetical protein AB8O38_06475 [Saccharomonospora xinjiangensis]|uniref:hypothetical protein n=1 Tax=Saccharomonospora xinjiangensis TaxID=75294 RepID=UPI0035100C6E